jgi:hypothetical protein
MSTSDGAPADGLQQAVDGLAARLGRSVAVDDTRGRLVVASRHFGDEDPLRTYAVMQRDSDPRVMAHFSGHGIYRWTSPGRIPADPELGFKARIGCPIRAHGIPFGHLFLIDDGVEPWEIDLAVSVAEEIGLLLHRRLVAREHDDGRRATLARDVLSPDPDTRAAAGRAVLAEGLAGALEPAVALSVHVPGAGASRSDSPEAALGAAFETVVRARPGDRALTSITGGRGTVLLLGEDATAERGRALGGALVETVRSPGRVGVGGVGVGGVGVSRGGVGVGRVVVGVGSVARGPDAARRSADEARVIADAATLLPSLGDVVGRDDLGVYAVLLAVPRDLVTDDLYPAGLRRLLERDTNDSLVDTLEAYLDCCGDATRTAAALHVHRSTLYYRLGRIESVTEVDLHDGHDRLALHLGLKLRRLRDASEGAQKGGSSG